MVPVDQGQTEMATTRATAWENPLIPVAVIGPPLVWDLRADPIWDSGHVAAQQAEHSNAFDPQPFSLAANLNLGGHPYLVSSDEIASLTNFGT